jgi:hypothetical protein
MKEQSPSIMFSELWIGMLIHNYRDIIDGREGPIHDVLGIMDHNVREWSIILRLLLMGGTAIYNFRDIIDGKEGHIHNAPGIMDAEQG